MNATTTVRLRRLAHDTRLVRLAALALAFAGAAFGLAAGAQASDNWPRFRGPGANPAIEDDPNLPDRWSRTENVEWVTAIPGLGWSSPIVWGNRVFLTAAVAEGDFERPQAGLYAPRGRSEPPQVVHDWRVYCLDLATGKEIWSRSVRSGIPEFPRHQKHTYAAETPATDGERVYVRFGDLGVYAFTMDGEPVWSFDTPYRPTMYDYGSASSPVVHDDQVIILYDNEEESWIAALDKATGEQRWRTDRDEVSSWATPLVWSNEARTEIVTNGKNRIRSYSLDGDLLWEMDGRMSWAAIATPLAAHDMVYVNSGYFQDQRRPVYAVRPGALGDITLDEDATESEFVAWHQPRAGNYNTSPLVYKGVYYSLLDRGFFEAYDALTGEPVYGRQRVAPRGGASFTSSPWAYNDRVFALSEQGDTYVIRAGARYEVLHINSLDEMAMASPAVAGDRLLIRTRSKLYSIRNAARPDADRPDPDPAE